MSDNKKYYYMRLKEDFFDSDEIKIMESMQDGYLFCNILLKLYLLSLKDNGRLVFRGVIPYSPEMIASVTRHQVGTVRQALELFKQMELIEVMDTGAIYMLDIQNYIGQSSTEAERKKQYRQRIADEKTHVLPLSDKCPDKSPPENRDKRIEIRDKSKPYSPLQGCPDLFERDLEKLVDLNVSDKARPAQETVAEFLTNMGFECVLEYPVNDRGDGRSGRIDIIAKRDGRIAAIEIDRNSVREKSVFKLNQIPNAYKVAIVRNGAATNIPGVDLVVPLQIEPAEPSLLQRRFIEFWSAYPKKVGKGAAEKAWSKIKPDKPTFDAIMQAVEVQKHSDQWHRNNGQYIPNPTTWLNQRRWEDEPGRPAMADTGTDNIFLQMLREEQSPYEP